MANRLCGRCRRGAGLPGLLGTVLAAGLALPAAAGLLTTDQTLADFHFVGGMVDYNPDPAILTIPLNSAYTFTATDPALAFGNPNNVHDPLRGSLHITSKGNNFGHFASADFNLFGSLQANTSRSESELLKDEIAALRPDSKPATLSFLSDHDTIVGPLASHYRSVGVFTLVSGVDDVTWVQGFEDGASVMQLVNVEDAVTNGNRGAR
jgi:hypothetical protein